MDEDGLEVETADSSIHDAGSGSGDWYGTGYAVIVDDRSGAAELATVTEPGRCIHGLSE